MNFMERYFSFLIKRRIMLFFLASVTLLVMMVVFSHLLGGNPNPAMYSIFFLVSSVVINVVAASLWYSLLVTNQKLQRSEPLMRAFPFFKDKSTKVYIIFASVPSATGHETTGIGEARGLGMLLESLQSIGFPTEKIHVNYSSRYSDEEMKCILENQNVILLGGPNYNKFTRSVIDRNHERFAYVFMEEKEELISTKSGTVGNNKKHYSGTIVNNTIRQEIVTYPEPKNVVEDALVTKDCGIVARIRNCRGKSITLLAGGMTSGVWVSAKLMTEYDLIEKWHGRLKPRNDECEFEIIFENSVENILSIEPEDIEIVKATELVS